jgi:hypothetical protein
MTALVARIGHPDFPGRDLVGQTEKSTVRTGVRAKALRAQKVHRHESAYK